MGFYLWVSEGDDGDDTRPVLASTDPGIIREFMRLLTNRVCGGSSGRQGVEAIQDGHSDCPPHSGGRDGF